MTVKHEFILPLFRVLFCFLSFQGLPAEADNLLEDPNFEESTPNGSVPDPRYWNTESVGLEASSIVTAVDGRTGNGLYQYTGVDEDYWATYIYQDQAAQPGDIYQAGAWIKTLGSWLEGSKASIKINFLDSDKITLMEEFESYSIEEGGKDWTNVTLTGGPAPFGTAMIRYMVCLEKTEVPGLSVACCDDCFLRKISYPVTGSIEFSSIPECGESGELKGWVDNINPNDYKVVVFIYTDAWRPKSSFANPWTTLESDGTWACNYAIHPNDVFASNILAFIVPNEYELPSPLNNDPVPELPDELYDLFPYAGTIRSSCFDSISFSGYEWLVKESISDTVDPGDNYFSGSEDDVWADDDGLHMKISYRNGNWYCTEVFADAKLGYGTYIFQVNGDMSLLDPNIILGLFIWDDLSPLYNHREIDVELGRWGESENDNALFIVQPDIPGNQFRFNIEPGADVTTYIFTWQENVVSFQSLKGNFSSWPTQESMIASWSYRGEDIPVPGYENPRINFWLLGNEPSINNQDAEIVIQNFTFIPGTIPEVMLSTEAVEFNHVLIGNIDSGSLILINTGDKTFQIENLNINGNNSSNFYVDHQQITLDPNSSETIDVFFVPDSIGNFDASLDICIDGITKRVDLAGYGTPLEFTHIPQSPGDYLEGRVVGVNPLEYQGVAIYIQVGDPWWIKPNSYTECLLPLIKKNGFWKCDITPVATDFLATQIAAFLIPVGVNLSTLESNLVSLDNLCDNYPHNIVTKSPLTVNQFKVKAGRANNTDSLVASGDFCISQQVIDNTDIVHINVRSGDNLIYEMQIPFDSNAFKAGIYIYRNNENEIISVKFQNKHLISDPDYDLSLYSGSFLIGARKIDLSCLNYPVAFEIVFDETAIIDECLEDAIINNGKPIPIQFVSGSQDVIRTDSIRVNTRNNSLAIKGTIASSLDIAGMDSSDLTFTLYWGGQAFVVPADKINKIPNTRKFTCRNADLEGGGKATIAVDLDKCKFSISTKDTPVEWQTGFGFLGIQFNDFNESILVELL